MGAEIIVAVITGVFTFAGVVVSVLAGNKKTQKSIKEQSELTLYRIEQLEKKQDKHNTLIERMYKVEDRLNILEERQHFADHRMEDIEEHKVC